MRLIVCDTGPILHLQEAGLLKLIKKAGKVYIPQRVDIEMASQSLSWKTDKPGWIKVEPLLPDEARQAESIFLSGLLDMGETEAIILAKRLKTTWFLTDDSEARIFATSLGLEVHGSLGVVLWSAAMGNLTYKQSMNALEKLSQTSLWISKATLKEAEKAVKKIAV